jgi:minor histocompatibility antigen H13
VDYFFYDIFWVFGTDVMVTVAKSFDAPIKLLFPKSLWAAEYQFSMLGLGDIVIPGVFIALLLRYDHHRNINLKQFSTPYFNNTMVGYFVGLATTIIVMHTFQAAQPALLYLVPTCIGASLGTAVILGDVSGLFAYSEEEEEGPDAQNKVKKCQ